MRPFLILVFALTFLGCALVLAFLLTALREGFGPMGPQAGQSQESPHLTPTVNRLEADLIRAYRFPDQAAPTDRTAVSTVVASDPPHSASRWE